MLQFLSGLERNQFLTEPDAFSLLTVTTFLTNSKGQMTDTLDKSWQRYPQARIRMREGDLDILAKALKNKGFCILGQPRIELLDDGIYIQMGTNTSKGSHIIALPVDIFIPFKFDEAVEVSPEVEEPGEDHEQSSVQVDEASR